MKLLIVTQAVDTEDPVLGFFARWIEEFAKHAERVEVICLKEGKHALPANVRVYSLGKERGASRVKYVFNFYRHIWHLRHNYDAVFVHMNPEYIMLGGLLWRLWGKRVAFWYTHKNVDLKLCVAVLFAHVVMTASKESFRLSSPKVRVVGHGIDMAQFAAIPHVHREEGTLRVLTIGRLSATKRLMEMFAALDVLAARGEHFTFIVAGVPATGSDEAYEKQVRHELLERPYAAQVHFLGAVSHADIPKLLAAHDVFLNLSTTGSMDKAVLEALVAGMPAVTTNEAFRDLLLPLGLFVEDDSPATLADALGRAATVDVSAVANKVRERFALPRTIETILGILSS